MWTCLKDGPYLNVIDTIPTEIKPTLQLRGEKLSLAEFLVLFKALKPCIEIKKGSFKSMIKYIFIGIVILKVSLFQFKKLFF